MPITNRLPRHAIGGLTVTLGLLAVQLVATLVLGGEPAQLATIGAIYATFPHGPGRPGHVLRRVLVSGVVGAFTTVLVLALRAHPPALGLAVFPLVFAATMTTAWGKRAGPLAFVPVLAIVFGAALPLVKVSLATVSAIAFGVVLYAAWATLTAALLERRYRVLAVATAVSSSASLLRARAGVLVDGASSGPLTWVREEAALARDLEAARELAFTAPESAIARRDAAVVLLVTEIRDVLLASTLDLDELGDDAEARALRDRLAEALRVVADALEVVAAKVRAGETVSGSDVPDLGRAGAPLREVVMPETDPRLRLLPVLAARLQHLADDVLCIFAVVREGDAPRALRLPRTELERFVADEAWPLATLRENLTWRSPVARHAVRSALAVSVAWFFANALPWAAHPYWLVLSVAVVLRGTLEQTLARRKSRVVGTAIGCAVALVIGGALPEEASRLAFPIAAGAAHAFVDVRYVLTAAAGTVMALLQAQLAHPDTTLAVLERLADAVVGGLIAWAFSFVLPSWERRSLPDAIARALDDLRDYALLSLDVERERGERDVAQRLARQRAYEKLEAVAAALQRSAVEPRRVRPPAEAVVTFLDGAQRLMAHLSSLRLLRMRRGDRLADEDARAALVAARGVLAELLEERAGDEAPPPDAEGLALDRIDAPPERDPLPWLVRRLHVTVRDARRVGEAARDARASFQAA